MSVSEASRRAKAYSEEEWRRSRALAQPQKVLLMVDLSYQVYRASAAHPMLTSRRIFTGGLYGFYTSISKMIRETQATEILFCQDVKPYKRSETYPEYKQLRKKNADEELLKMFKQSMKLVLETLETTGLPIWGIPGFESDDLIGHVVRRYWRRYDAIYAGSNDSDLYQLLWAETFSIYKDSIATTMNLARLLKKTGLDPDQFMLASALQGTHNDIEGIAGVGEKTAAKMVKSPPLLRAAYERHGEMIERNRKLIQLPHPDFPKDLGIPQPTRYNARDLYRALTRYDIDVTGSMERSFDQVGQRSRIDRSG